MISTLVGTTTLVSAAEVNPVSATTTDPKTGIALPDPGEIEKAIPQDWSSIDFPFDDQGLFNRLDSTPDAKFYEDPRLVEHVDDQAVQRMTKYISTQAIQKGDSVLDLCSSWTSHLDPSIMDKSNLKRMAGLGMNQKELESNPALTDYSVQDLNMSPVLPYDDQSFSVVLCQLSIDYLTRPLEVLKDVGRVLVPGGTIHIIFSNRLFLSKAVAVWTGADDIDHAFTVASYLHFCEGSFDKIYAVDLSMRKGRKQMIVGDPLYVVTATKV